MKLVHFADLHLDSPFAWAGAAGEVARHRREALRETLRRIVALTREVGADALLCGGDLYEHDRVTADTAEFLRTTFAELDPIRVFLAPGNHDWYGPQSLYALTEWSPNVHVFREASLEPVELYDGLTLPAWSGLGFQRMGLYCEEEIANGATVSNGTEIGEGSVIAAGAVLVDNTKVPPGVIMVGVPAKERGPVSEAQAERFRWTAKHYAELAQEYKAEGLE